VWLLLAGSCCVRTVDWTYTASVANVLALLALAVYANFCLPLCWRTDSAAGDSEVARAYAGATRNKPKGTV
jgi:hypothetical protein